MSQLNVSMLKQIFIGFFIGIISGQNRQLYSSYLDFNINVLATHMPFSLKTALNVSSFIYLGCTWRMICEAPVLSWFLHVCLLWVSLPSLEVMAKMHRQTITRTTFTSMMAEQVWGGNVSLVFKYWHISAHPPTNTETCMNMYFNQSVALWKNHVAKIITVIKVNIKFIGQYSNAL